ncbi:MAG: hypothetical protein RMK29_20815 [Myxococcales bacterium]|nr:hypothetical protein [Myxococcota bacterium]MDW8284155.1 hypothetical protein [Myxococcales bacterium]
MAVSLLADNPAKRRVEILLLGYSPVWMAILAGVIFTRAFSAWHDAGHLLLGVGLCLLPWLLPFLPLEPGRPLGARYATKVTVFIALLSAVQNYFGAHLFFRGLGMQYHFPVRLVLNGTPLFLYFVTVAYFSTYFVLLQVALRAVDRWFPTAPRLLWWTVLGVLSCSLAFAETYFMANDWLKDVFSYADKARTLKVGSLCYGSLFVVSAPLFIRIDEDPARPTPLAQVFWEVLGANMLILLLYELYLGTILS